jgi:predicted HAD superfamily Cof-like phosphohydrolase
MSSEDAGFADKVREFHEAFGLGVATEPTPRPENWKLRIALLREEFEEYVAAAEAGDLVEVADALADMAYVIYGTACEYGIPLDAVLDEVHRSNMSKLGADGRPVYREDGKVLKGPAFRPPDIAAALYARRSSDA